jgi:large subunit ribosomal protein L38e
VKTAARIKPAKKSASVRTSKSKTAGGKEQIKFKIRASRHLHTLILTDKVKVDKIKQSLPPNLTVTEVGGKEKKTKK